MIGFRSSKCLSILAAVFFAKSVLAQSLPARTETVCVSVDEEHDTLPPKDRAAALLLIARQFTLAGKRVVQTDCSTPYTLSHVTLGRTITVTLSGPNDHREGTAIGLDDLPALYSQMVRSIVTGRSLGGIGVTDRTNVTVSQTSPRRIQSDSFAYARLGYGAAFGGQSYGRATMGFGYRDELDSFGLDVSFFNFQTSLSNAGNASGGYRASKGGATGSLLKLEGLYFLKPEANASTYVGGGMSWGTTDFSTGGNSSFTSWHGSGLQGELTFGYELARDSTLRLFLQVDAVLPFYRATGEARIFSNSYAAPWGATTGHRYTPSISLSIGFGRQRGQSAH